MKTQTTKALAIIVAMAFSAMAGERPADDRPLPGENTWEYIQRNHLKGVLGRYTIEISPHTPLLAEHPWLEPKPTDPWYDAEMEKQIAAGSKTVARIYKAGVFIQYSVVTPNKPKPERSPAKRGERVARHRAGGDSRGCHSV